MADYPGTDDVHRDVLLTNMSVGYRNAFYIARRLFPEVLVNAQSDIVPKYDKSHWFRLQAKTLSEREPPPVTGYSIDMTDTYYCKEWGIGHFISDRRRANTDVPFNADRDGSMWLADKMDLAFENDFVTNYWKTGVWDTDLTGGSSFTKWSTLATSTPIVDIRTGKRTIRRALAGFEPNVMAFGDLTFDVLVDHPDFLDRIKYGSDSNSPAMVTKSLIAQVCGLERVEVGLSMYTTDIEGTAEASVTYTPMWDDDALMLYVPARPSLFNPAAGYKFAWRTVYGTPRYVRKRRDPISAKGDLLELFEFWDSKQIAGEAGVFYSDCVD